VIGIGVENYVIDGDIQGVLGERRFDLVGGAVQGFGTVDILVHLLHGLVEFFLGAGGGLS